jgi:hypothetical protein
MTGMRADSKQPWRKKIFRFVLWSFGVTVFYVLSIGPVIRFTEYSTDGRTYRLPTMVELIYYPLLNVPNNPLNSFLDAYVQIWLNRK